MRQPKDYMIHYTTRSAHNNTHFESKYEQIRLRYLVLSSIVNDLQAMRGIFIRHIRGLFFDAEALYFFGISSVGF